MPSRKILAIAGAVVVVIAAIVGIVIATGGEDETPATTTTTAPTTTTTTAPPPVAPLTGLPADDAELLERPALVVKVDNSPRALTLQDGLDAADVVFVEQVEGGATRLAVVFHSTDATVGPVRSARTSDVDIVRLFGRPLFAYSGGIPEVVRRIREAGVIDVSPDARGGAYEQRGGGVLRFFAPTERLYQDLPDDSGPPQPLFEYRGDDDEPAGEPAEGVTLSYGGRVDTNVSYRWDDGNWSRRQNGEPYETASGRISPANVVVQITTYSDSGFRDTTGAISPEADLVGEGDVLVFTAGRVIEGRWSRPDAGAPTTYTDAVGQPILLTPGRTWVELAPPGRVEVNR